MNKNNIYTYKMINIYVHMITGKKYLKLKKSFQQGEKLITFIRMCGETSKEIEKIT